jgi:hypothetical protein
MKSIESTREMCKICGSIIRVGFHVPDDIWEKAIHPYHQNSAVCIKCFTARADEKMLPWDKNIEFFPVSMNTHLTYNYKAEAWYRNKNKKPPG